MENEERAPSLTSSQNPIFEETEVTMNKKMGIEVHIPDPLKRDVGRRIAQPMRSGYGRRPSYGGGGRRPSYGGGGRRPSYGGGHSRDGPARDQYKRRGSARPAYRRQNRDTNKKW